MSQLRQRRRLDVGRFAEVCKRLRFDETLTARVVLEDAQEEPRDILVQVIRFHLTHDLALIGIGTDLKLRERFVSPDWLKDRLNAVRKIEAILADLNRRKSQTPNNSVGQAVWTGYKNAH
jgi:hypothetical protein